MGVQVPSCSQQWAVPEHISMETADLHFWNNTQLKHTQGLPGHGYDLHNTRRVKAELKENTGKYHEEKERRMKPYGERTKQKNQ